MPIQREYSSPFIYLILVLPFGISGGFIGVTLPFLLVKNGFSVAAAAAVTALAVIPLAYMIAIDGWLHDYAGIKMMLFGETLIGFFFILIFLLIMKHYKIHKMNEITY